MRFTELLARLSRGERFRVKPLDDGSYEIAERPRASLEAVVIKADGTRIDLGEIWASEQEKGK